MKKRGFTIIEVVLVLAIAGLIFLMVFIALPALQRSQRNTRRRQDISRISTAVTQYLASNNKLPFWVDGSGYKVIDYKFVTNYVESDAKCYDSSNNACTENIKGKSVRARAEAIFKCDVGDCSEFSDPDGSPYGFIYFGNNSNVTSFLGNDKVTDNYKNHAIYVSTTVKCSGDDNVFTASDGANDFALAYILEGGSVYCVDNS